MALARARPSVTPAPTRARASGGRRAGGVGRASFATRARVRVSACGSRASVERGVAVGAFRGAPEPKTEEEEGSVLDFPEEYVRAVPSRRPDIFPDLKEPKTPMPRPMPGDPEMPDEEEEEKERKENPGEPGTCDVREWGMISIVLMRGTDEPLVWIRRREAGRRRGRGGEEEEGEEEEEEGRRGGRGKVERRTPLNCVRHVMLRIYVATNKRPSPRRSFASVYVSNANIDARARDIICGVFVLPDTDSQALR